MNSIRIVAVRDFLRNVATKEELETLEQDIAFRRDSPGEQTTCGNSKWYPLGNNKKVLVGENGPPDPALTKALENFKE